MSQAVSLAAYLSLAKHWLLDVPMNDALIDNSEGCIYYYYQQVLSKRFTFIWLLLQ